MVTTRYVAVQLRYWLREGPQVEGPVAYGSTAQAVIDEGNRLFVLYDVSVHDPTYKRI